MAVLKMAQCAQVFPSSGKAQLLLADIKKLHLEYLRTERSESNIRLRQKLEEEITRYLTIVHHKEKFPCALFLEILRQTVETKPNFSAYQVASAFKALESYAFNLIAHPWRKEYHVVRLYCGYFKYNVDRWLVNAMYVLAMMGYEQVGDMVVELQEPIDPDQVIVTSLNCLIAAVECQIMTQIYDAMKGHVSWLDIAQVRRHHTGDVSKACQLLSTPKHEKSDKHIRSYSEDRSRLADCNWIGRVEKLIDVPSMIHDAPMYSVGVGGQLYSQFSSYDNRLLWESINSPENFACAVTNGHDTPDAALVPKSADEHMADSYSLVKEKKKPVKPRDLTRDDSWSYVDRSLEHRGCGRDRVERMDPLRRTPIYMNKQKSAEETLRDMSTNEMLEWANSPLEPQNNDGNLINFNRIHPFGYVADTLYRHAPNYTDISNVGYHHFPTTDLAHAISCHSASSKMQPNAMGRSTVSLATVNAQRRDVADGQAVHKGSSSRNSFYDNVPATSSSSSAKANYAALSYPVMPVTSTNSPAHYPFAADEAGRKRPQQASNYNTVPVPRHHAHYGPVVAKEKETASIQVQTDSGLERTGTGQQRAGSSNGHTKESRWSHDPPPTRGSSEERERERERDRERKEKERNGSCGTAAAVASGYLLGPLHDEPLVPLPNTGRIAEILSLYKCWT